MWSRIHLLPRCSGLAQTQAEMRASWWSVNSLTIPYIFIFPYIQEWAEEKAEQQGCCEIILSCVDWVIIFLRCAAWRTSFPLNEQQLWSGLSVKSGGMLLSVRDLLWKSLCPCYLVILRLPRIVCFSFSPFMFCCVIFVLRVIKSTSMLKHPVYCDHRKLV